MRIYGVAYRSRSDEGQAETWAEHVVWEDSRAEAISEYNSRDDKHWNAALVSAQVSCVEIIHDSAWRDEGPWDRDYEGHYFEDDQ